MSSAILALAIGANTAVYTAAQALILQPLPYPQAEQLVALHEILKDGAEAQTSLAALPDYQASRAFSSVAAGRPRSFGLQAADGAAVQVMMTGMVTADWFRVLGVQPALGRTWTAEEPVIVLGHEAWERLFQGDPGVLGRRVLINGHPVTVVGVLPPTFRYLWGTERIAAWIPISQADYGGQRDLRAVDAIARLRIPAAEAQAAMNVLAEQLGASYEASRQGGIGLRNLRLEQQGRYHRPLAILSAGALLLSLIACANLGHLLLVRFAARRRELAIRLSVGARQRDLAAEFFSESLAVSVLGTGGGWMISSALLGVISFPVEADWHTTAFALGTGITALVALPLLPLWKARRLSIEQEMRDGGAATPGGNAMRARTWIVAMEVAVSVVLLAGCLLLARSLQELLHVDPGFVTERVFRFGLGIPEGRYDTPAKMAAFYPKLEAELRNIPGITEAGVGLRLPLSGATPKWRFTFAAGEAGNATLNLATTGFFQTLRLRLLDGRLFREQEAESAAVVNDAFVRRYGKGVGTKIDFRWNDPASARIVGVVSDARQQGLDVPAHPEVFLNLASFPAEGMQVVARAERDDPGITTAMSSALRRVDPELQSATPAPMADWVEQSIKSRRVAFGISGVLAATAILLAGVGLYGVVAALGQQRRRELALRAALGATPAAILALVLAQSARYTAGGLALGLAGFFATAEMLQAHVYGVAEWDPGALAGVILGTGLLSLAAGIGPAMRASKINPGNELR